MDMCVWVFVCLCLCVLLPFVFYSSLINEKLTCRKAGLFCYAENINFFEVQFPFPGPGPHYSLCSGNIGIFRQTSLGSGPTSPLTSGSRLHYSLKENSLADGGKKGFLGGAWIMPSLRRAAWGIWLDTWEKNIGGLVRTRAEVIPGAVSWDCCCHSATARSAARRMRTSRLSGHLFQTESLPRVSLNN